jgi:hypothetical protein
MKLLHERLPFLIRLTFAEYVQTIVVGPAHPEQTFEKHFETRIGDQLALEILDQWIEAVNRVSIKMPRIRILNGCELAFRSSN